MFVVAQYNVAFLPVLAGQNPSVIIIVPHYPTLTYKGETPKITLTSNQLQTCHMSFTSYITSIGSQMIYQEGSAYIPVQNCSEVCYGELTKKNGK